MAEDRFSEALHAIVRLDKEYHDPRAFRYNLNAFLSSTRSVSHILQFELEKRGDVQWWKERKLPFSDDPVLRRIASGRNTTLHQKAIFDGSRVLIGLYRGRRHKLSVGGNVPHDVPSATLLKWWQDSEGAKLFLDADRSDMGEQYGVWRRYFIKELSATEDALVVCWRAIARTNALIAAAHELVGTKVWVMPEQDLIRSDVLAKVSVLLESDVDPSLITKWGW